MDIQGRKLIKIATAGSVDDGKSTLIGRLLYDTHSLTTDKIEAIERSSKQRGYDYLDFSLATDGLVAEREQGITIDVAHIYFNTDKTNFIVADTPGHVEYTRNMVTGASTSQVAIILIDARKGVIEQTYRHFFISNLLRINHVVVAINKMDLVEYSEEVFLKIKADFDVLVGKSDFAEEQITFIPLSALKGENVTRKSEHMPWYVGNTLLDHLEVLEPEDLQESAAARFPVQLVIRPKTEAYHDFRGFSGKLYGNSAYVSIRTKKEQLAELLTSNANKREDILDRIAHLEESLTTIQPRLAEEKELFDGLAEQVAQLTEEVEAENKRLAEKSQTFNQENITYIQQVNRVNSLDQEIEFKQNAFESSKERIEKSQSELANLDAEIKSLLDNNEVKDDELIELYSEKESIEQGVTEAEKDYYGARGLIDETDTRIRSLQKSKEGFDHLLSELHNAINEIKLKMSGMKERLSVEFELDLDQLMEENPNLDPEFIDFAESELRDLVRKQKERLEKIGPINPMAMEAYDEIKVRYDFITGQKADLVKAKESLLSTISEIDQVAKDTFLDAFGKIKENFVKVFRSLFTEQDDCDLTLVDPGNPLESPIEIMAKPKGKRPLTINQLSGGEKTLTATSLLFSIYLLKPAPFCIFDEVDAPLDDANIDKFNQIIQKFSSESQFIIVTHNKRTMASTDIMYGVTMIEAGVSRVVPVDLRELA